MKRLALVCFALTGALALAQQPAEWRRNIAEGNKAATWEDTSAFIVNTITSSESNYFVKKNAAPAPSRARHHGDSEQPSSAVQFIYWEYGISTPARCVLEEKNFFYDGSLSSVVVTHIDLAHVDPLSIRARLGQWFQTDAYAIEMTGTNQANFLDSTVTIRSLHIPDADICRKINPAYLVKVCSGTETNCRSEHKTRDSNQERFSDQDLAHRVARAFMHATLQCGGTKANEPLLRRL